MNREYQYTVDLNWTGNLGEGTSSYTSYTRNYEIKAEGKPILMGSSDPAFKGDMTRWNPEELLLASIAACHMLWYLHLCSDKKIIVESYQDVPTGVMILEQGIGKFTEATLNPVVTIRNSEHTQLAIELHQKANQLCFIANSVNFPIEKKPIVHTAEKN